LIETAGEGIGQTTALPREDGGSLASPRTLLVIDDSSCGRQLLESLREAFPDTVTLFADNAGALASYLSAALPDAIIVRQNGPWGDTRQLLSRIRTYCRTAPLFVAEGLAAVPEMPGIEEYSCRVLSERDLVPGSLRDGPLGSMPPAGLRTFPWTPVRPSAPPGLDEYEGLESERFFGVNNPALAEALPSLESIVGSVPQGFGILMENISDVIWAMSPGFRFTFLSPSVRDVLGYEPIQLLLQDPFDLVLPQDRMRVRESFTALLGRSAGRERGSGGPMMLELELLRSDGRTAPVEIRMNLVRDSTGRTRGLLGVARDIGERRQIDRIREVHMRIAEAAVDSEDLPSLCSRVRQELAKLLDTEHMHISLAGGEAGPISLPIGGGGSCQGGGSPGLELLSERVVESSRPRVFSGREIRLIADPGGTGAPLPEAWAGVPLKISGRSFGCLAVMDYDDPTAFSRQDMAVLEFVSGQIAHAVSRMMAHERLKQSERRFRQLFETSGIGMVLFSEDGRVLEMNNAVSTMLGRPGKGKFEFDLFRHELPGLDTRKLLAGESVSLEMVIDLSEREQTFFTSQLHGRKWLGITVLPLGLESSTHSGFLMQLEDRTRERKYEALLGALSEVLRSGGPTADIPAVVMESASQRLVPADMAFAVLMISCGGASTVFETNSPGPSQSGGLPIPEATLRRLRRLGRSDSPLQILDPSGLPALSLVSDASPSERPESWSCLATYLCSAGGRRHVLLFRSNGLDGRSRAALDAFGEGMRSLLRAGAGILRG